MPLPLGRFAFLSHTCGGFSEGGGEDGVRRDVGVRASSVCPHTYFTLTLGQPGNKQRYTTGRQTPGSQLTMHTVHCRIEEDRGERCRMNWEGGSQTFRQSLCQQTIEARGAGLIRSQA